MLICFPRKSSQNVGPMGDLFKIWIDPSGSQHLNAAHHLGILGTHHDSNCEIYIITQYFENFAYFRLKCVSFAI